MLIKGLILSRWVMGYKSDTVASKLGLDKHGTRLKALTQI